MAKSTLDTPFRKGEKVQTTVTIDDIEEGTAAKIKVSNGLGSWRRYWIMFADGSMRGQVSHEELVRPSQLDQWHQREIDREQAALVSAEAASADEATAAVESGDGSAPTGLAAMVPAHLLERSKAAKARLTGG